MADYIEPAKIEDLPDKESLEESDFFIVEDDEATKKSTIEKLKNSIGGIEKITPYFAVSESTTFYPSHEGNTASVLGTMILGTARIGDTGVWETEVPNATEYDYIWVSFYVEYADGTTEWMHPFTVTDKEAKETIAVLVKEMETAQADILKNSGLIAENAELLEEVSEKAAENTEQIEELSEKVNANADSIAENKEAISANADKITEIEKSLEDTDENVSKLDERVSTAETNIESDGEDIQSLKDTIEEQKTKIEELETTIADLQENKSNNIKIRSYSRDLSIEANESTSKTGSQSNDGYTSLGVMNITCNVPNVFVTSLVADSMTYAMFVTNCNDYDVEVSIGYSLLLVEND